MKIRSVCPAVLAALLLSACNGGKIGPVINQNQLR